MKTGVLIIGNGIAGLSTALFLAESSPSLSVTLLDKSLEEECNTKYAQGGMAAVLDQEKDSFSFHIEDTFLAGQGLSKPAVVQKVVRKAPEIIRHLENWGVDFDKNPDGTFALGLEGGHSQHRIVHRKDHTGMEIHSKLLSKIADHPQIRRITHTASVDLLTTDWQGEIYCQGVTALDWQDQHLYSIYADVVVLATGGLGQLFLHTTNPKVATGDGPAMAIRAGAKVGGLQYVQFHPTAIYDEHSPKSLLITEAIRGAGAYVLDHSGERFLFKGTPKGELATRDIVSGLIFQELERSGKPYVFLDARHLGQEYLLAHFPQVHENCRQYGYDLGHDLIPIAPAAHYHCGGIAVDHKGRTSIKNLYAVGECASTGLHGANRLASNSLSEAMVFAETIAKSILKDKDCEKPAFDSEKKEDHILAGNRCIPSEELNQTLFDLKRIMTAALVNPKETSIDDAEGLRFIADARKRIAELSEGKNMDLKTLELNNLLTVGERLLLSIERKETLRHPSA